jgi:hypothetical protein
MNTVPDILKASQEPIDNVIATVGQLSQAASKMPYYKFNNMWSRQMQGAVRLASHNDLVKRTDSFTGGRSAALGLARRLQVRGWRGQVRTAAHHRGFGRDLAQYAEFPQLHTAH